MDTKDLKIQIASDVNERDGIGIEVLEATRLVLDAVGSTTVKALP